MKYLKVKAILLLITAISILFITNSFGLNSLEQTAFVTTIGIDKQDDLFEATCSIIEKNANQTVSAKGRTLSEALGRIRLNSLKPNLSLCSSILFGQSVANEIPTLLTHFANSAIINPSINLVLSDSNAKNIIVNSSNSTENIGTTISNILNSKDKNNFNFSSANNALKNNLLVGSFILPVLNLGKPSEILIKENMPGEMFSVNTAFNKDLTSGTNNNNLSVTTLACFSNNKLQGFLTETETQTFFLLNTNSPTQSLFLDNLNENKLGADLKVISKTLSKNITGTSSTPKLFLKLSLTLSLKQLTENNQFPTITSLENSLKEDLLNLFEKAQTLDVDIFKIKENFVKFKNTEPNLTEIPNATLSQSVTINLITPKTA